MVLNIGRLATKKFEKIAQFMIIFCSGYGSGQFSVRLKKLYSSFGSVPVDHYSERVCLKSKYPLQYIEIAVILVQKVVSVPKAYRSPDYIFLG